MGSFCKSLTPPTASIPLPTLRVTLPKRRWNFWPLETPGRDIINPNSRMSLPNTSLQFCNVRLHRSNPIQSNRFQNERTNEAGGLVGDGFVSLEYRLSNPYSTNPFHSSLTRLETTRNKRNLCVSTPREARILVVSFLTTLQHTRTHAHAHI